MVLRVRGKNLEVLLWRRGAPPFEGRWSLPGGPLGASERLGTSAGRHLATKVDLTVIAHLEQLETRSDPERDPRGRVLATAYLALVSADVEPRIPADTAWHAAADLPPTAFDHGSIVGSATERLRAKLSYTNPAAARPTALGGRPATLYRFAARTLVVTNPFAAFRPPTLVSRSAVPVPSRRARHSSTLSAAERLRQPMFLDGGELGSRSGHRAAGCAQRPRGPAG